MQPVRHTRGPCFRTLGLTVGHNLAPPPTFPPHPATLRAIAQAVGFSAHALVLWRGRLLVDPVRPTIPYPKGRPDPQRIRATNTHRHTLKPWRTSPGSSRPLGRSCLPFDACGLSCTLARIPKTYARTVSASMVPNDDVARRMSRQRTRDTRPELALRRLLHVEGLRYRVALKVPGHPRRSIDIAFIGAKVAVFVDGCFWHACPAHATWPRANAVWWRQKLDANVRRDRQTDRWLRDAGWEVIRAWEHEDPRDAAVRVAAVVRRRGGKSCVGVAL